MRRSPLNVLLREKAERTKMWPISYSPGLLESGQSNHVPQIAYKIPDI